MGRNYRKDTGRNYIGTRPSAGSVRSICRKISELPQARYGLLDEGEIVERLNRAMLGWANYFRLGEVAPAYAAIDAHATKRLRQWLCRKHKVQSGKYVRYPDERLWQSMGLTRLKRADGQLCVGEGHDLEREPSAGNPHARFDERGEETWSRWGLRHRHDGESRRQTATPPTLDKRLSSTLQQLGPTARGSNLSPTSVRFDRPIQGPRAASRARSETGTPIERW